MQIRSLFPTAVGVDSVPTRIHYAFKEAFTENAMKHVLKNGQTGEDYGMIDMHLDPHFKPIMNYVHDRFIEYLDTFNVNTSMYDINYVKAWMQVLREYETPKHTHADSMYTWIYYINVPKNPLTNKLLCVENPIASMSPHMNNSNEGYPTMFSYLKDEDSNEFNTIVETFETPEGTFLIMPAHLKHWTVPAQGERSYDEQPPVKNIVSLKKNRICIAGDIMLSYKEEHARGKSMGMQPVSRWLTYK
jgi:hypothetical protein